MTPEHLDHIFSILNAVYPKWTGYSDPRFVAEEMEYKQKAVEKARARLSASALIR